MFYFVLGIIYGGDGWIIFVLLDLRGCVLVYVGDGFGLYFYVLGLKFGVEYIDLKIIWFFVM